MFLKTIHHVGIACSDIRSMMDWVKMTHEVIHCSGVITDDVQDIEVALLELANGSHIELVAGSKVDSFVQRRIGLYHLAYEVDDLTAMSEALTTKGCRQILGPIPAVLFGGRQIVFLVGPFGLIELIERSLTERST